MVTRGATLGRLRRRLTMAFVLVAGVSAAVLAGGAYLLIRLTWPDGPGLGLLAAALCAGWVAVVLLAAGAGHLLAGALLRPVARASRAAHAVAEELLGTPLDPRGQDEPDSWAATLADLATALHARIDASSEAQARERRFTADVAHELRTPVTALVAEASLLREHLAELPAEARRPAELLVADVVRLRRLVDELLEISRLDAGQVAVFRRPVEVRGLLITIVVARGWQEQVTVSGDPVTVPTDPRRLERVLANLLANAVIHGRVGVTAAVHQHDRTVTVTVSDRGPGIAPEHMPHLFDRFYKADPSRTGAGSGLGLAIAEENVRLLGARLRVRSAPGKGTEVSVELARHPSASAPAVGRATPAAVSIGRGREWVIPGPADRPR